MVSARVDSPDLVDVDVIFSHDMPTYADKGLTLYKINPKDNENRRRVKDVVLAVKPNLLIHGHYHVYRKMMWQVSPEDKPVEIIGLNMDGTKQESWFVLDA